MGEAISALGIGGVFILFLVLIPVWLAVEIKFPRDTDDFHQPDIDRAVRRQEKKDRIQKALDSRRR